MTEFTYETQTKDSVGRVVYICKCSICGQRCDYRRKIDKKPICVSCQLRQQTVRSKTKQRLKEDEIYKSGYAAGYAEGLKHNVKKENKNE